MPGLYSSRSRVSIRPGDHGNHVDWALVPFPPAVVRTARGRAMRHRDPPSSLNLAPAALMTNRLTPEICVIGAGSGAQAIAAAAAAAGVSAVLVTRNEVDGHRRLATAALIAAARHAHVMRSGKAFGILPAEPEIDFRAIGWQVNEAVAAAAPNASVDRFVAMGVRVVKGEARFLDRWTLMAGDVEIRARHFVIATGSRPQMPPVPGIEDVEALTVDTVFGLKRLPGRLVVVGGSPSGLALAQVYRRLGSDVTVIETGGVLAGDDPELTAIVLDNLRAEGVEVLEGVGVERIERRGKTGVRVHCVRPDGEAATVDGTHLLVATGHRPNVEGLDLEKAGIAVTDLGITVSDRLLTTNSRAYAIGQVASGVGRTDIEDYHATLVVQALLFRRPAPQQPQIVPSLVQTEPELARVGLTEAEARTAHGRISILRWPYAENDRARAERKTGGLVKLVVDRKGRLLGAAIVGANAGELIAMWALAISRGYALADMADYVPAAPTLGEIGKRAAISYSAGTARKPLTRRLTGFLRMFG